MHDESDSHARGGLLWLLRWLLQGAQRIVCPPRVFVPFGVWDVVPSSLRLWHLLRIPALILRARRAHFALQVLRFLHVLLRVSLRVFPCLFIRHSLGRSIGAVLDRWRVIEPELLVGSRAAPHLRRFAAFSCCLRRRSRFYHFRPNGLWRRLSKQILSFSPAFRHKTTSRVRSVSTVSGWSYEVVVILLIFQSHDPSFGRRRHDPAI